LAVKPILPDPASIDVEPSFIHILHFQQSIDGHVARFRIRHRFEAVITQPVPALDMDLLLDDIRVLYNPTRCGDALWCLKTPMMVPKWTSRIKCRFRILYLAPDFCNLSYNRFPKTSIYLRPFSTVPWLLYEENESKQIWGDANWSLFCSGWAVWFSRLVFVYKGLSRS
jgi:hypothetical protein